MQSYNSAHVFSACTSTCFAAGVTRVTDRPKESGESTDDMAHSSVVREETPTYAVSETEEGQKCEDIDKLRGAFQRMGLELHVRSRRLEENQPLVCEISLEDAIKELEELMEKAVIFFFPGETPPKEVLVDWLAAEGVTEADSVRSKGRGLFFIRIKNEETRQEILNLRRCNCQEFYGYILPWTPEAERGNYKPDLIPMWVELTDLPTVFLESAKKIFSMFGDVLATPSARQIQGSTSPCACVLWELNKPAPKTIVIRLEGLDYEQKVTFLDLQGSYFRCWKSGEWSRDCSLNSPDPQTQEGRDDFSAHMSDQARQTDQLRELGNLGTAKGKIAMEDCALDAGMKQKKKRSVWVHDGGLLTERSEGISTVGESGNCTRRFWDIPNFDETNITNTRVLSSCGLEPSCDADMSSDSTGLRSGQKEDVGQTIEKWHNEENQGDLECVSWRIGSLLSRGRASLVLTHLLEQGPVDVIALQDFKMEVKDLQVLLEESFPRYELLAAKATDGGGTALLIHQSVIIHDHGWSARGDLTWANVRKGAFSTWIGSLLGAGLRTSRQKTWEMLRLMDWAEEDEGLLMGDWGVNPEGEISRMATLNMLPEETEIMKAMIHECKWRDLWKTARETKGEDSTWMDNRNPSFWGRTTRAYCRNVRMSMEKIRVEHKDTVCSEYRLISVVFQRA